MSKRSKSSSKGYGIANVSKRNGSKRVLNAILKKSWKDITSLELDLLYGMGYDTEFLSKKFKVSSLSLINKLRLG